MHGYVIKIAQITCMVDITELTSKSHTTKGTYTMDTISQSEIQLQDVSNEVAQLVSFFVTFHRVGFVNSNNISMSVLVFALILLKMS